MGESGSGKSVANLTILGLTRSPNAEITGRIMFEGNDLLQMSSDDLRSVRGNRISMIFQDPLSSLHPFYKVGKQLVEAIQALSDLSNQDAMARAVELLGLVGIPDPERRAGEYPHEFSGGMRQRAMIAMALALEPDLLIADEPTTALDVTIQAQILELMRALREETGTAIVLITHDLGVIAEVADEVAVMYAGKIVERAPVAALFAQPQHPYTIGLLGSIPQLHLEQDRLAAIEGQVPNASTPVSGCRFNPRCPFAVDICRKEIPPLREIVPGHAAACWRAPL